MSDQLKVLIISHNPIMTCDSMGKTMQTLFSAFSPDELCQFYIYPSLPDVRACGSFYRMTDKEILRSYLFRRAGRELTDGEIGQTEGRLFESERDESLYRSRKNKTPIRYLLRDLMWKCAHWFNRDLRAWVEREKPTCIFLAPGSAKFIYNVALKLSRKYKLPIVTYICDDFYFVRGGKGLLERLRLRLLRKKMEETIGRSAHLIVICRELETAYSERFGVPATVVMTGSNYPVSDSVRNTETAERLTYMGAVRCGRYRSLSEIGAALDAINAEKGTDYTLDIYTAEKDEAILAELRKHRSVRLQGFVSGAEFDRIFHAAQLLVHTESFAEEDIDEVKYSVSTKIANSLASGICLFAYGSDCVASMRHLTENRCAICATARDDLRARLEEAFENRTLREETARNALAVAKRCHDEAKNSAVCREILETASGCSIGRAE